MAQKTVGTGVEQCVQAVRSWHELLRIAVPQRAYRWLALSAFMGAVGGTVALGYGAYEATFQQPTYDTQADARAAAATREATRIGLDAVEWGLVVGLGTITIATIDNNVREAYARDTEYLRAIRDARTPTAEVVPFPSSSEALPPAA